MWDLFHLNIRIARLTWNIVDLQRQAWTTIVLRQPILLGDNVQAQKESTAMIVEKVQATIESSLALAGAYASFFRQPLSPLASATLWVRFAEVGLKPYQRKVTANRRRLTRERL